MLRRSPRSRGPQRLLEHRSRDSPTPCPEPPPSSPIPERCPRSLAACKAPGEGGAGRRDRARVGSGRAGRRAGERGRGRRGVPFGDGEGGERRRPELPHPADSPQPGTVAALPACCQPHPPCAPPARVGRMGLQRWEQPQALGAFWSGVGGGFLVTGGIAGVL